MNNYCAAKEHTHVPSKLAVLAPRCGSSRQLLALLTTALIGLGGIVPPVNSAPNAGTATPIQHLVIVFQENVSFDHYFGTYPNAANPPGEPPFQAADGTPSSLTA